MDKKLSGQRNQCPGCGEYFNSNHAFDKHRTGEYSPNTRKCLSKDEMADIGMHFGKDGFWRGSKMPERTYEVTQTA